MKLLVFSLVLLMSMSAYSESFYKCDIDGKKSYQDTPCEGTEIDENKIKIRVPSLPEVSDRKSTDHWDNLAHQYKLRMAVEKRKIMIGMNPTQVKRSWGKPSSIRKSFIAGVSSEQWVYRGRGGGAQYVYFDNGLVTGWN